jgi:hypothetical protein
LTKSRLKRRSQPSCTLANAPPNQQKRVNYHATHIDADQLFNLLTTPEFFEYLEEHLSAHRERLFPPAETLTMSLAQAMKEDRSSQRIVNDSAISP